MKTIATYSNGSYRGTTGRQEQQGISICMLLSAYASYYRKLLVLLLTILVPTSSQRV